MHSYIISMFLGANFNLRYLHRLAKESRIPLRTLANSASPMLNFCCTKCSIRHILPESSICLHCPLIFRPVSVQAAISFSVKINFASSEARWTGPVIRGLTSRAWIFASVAAETC